MIQPADLRSEAKPKGLRASLESEGNQMDMRASGVIGIARGFCKPAGDV